MPDSASPFLTYSQDICKNKKQHQTKKKQKQKQKKPETKQKDKPARGLYFELSVVNNNSIRRIT